MSALEYLDVLLDSFQITSPMAMVKVAEVLVTGDECTGSQYSDDGSCYT